MPILEFEETQFPDGISYGAKGGPRFNTGVVVASSGFEQRNVNWTAARGEWDVAHGLKTTAEAAELIAFFRAMRGRATGFRFKDWSDYRHDMTDPLNATPHSFFQGDGVTVNIQLAKVYQVGTSSITRDITKPIDGTFTLYTGAGAPIIWFPLTEVPSSPAAFEYTIDYTTGAILLGGTPPTSAFFTGWTGEFDVPVRFDTDSMDVVIDNFDSHNWQVPVVEIRV